MSELQPIKPDTPEWKEAHATVDAAEAQTNWVIGDVALSIAPMGNDGVNNGALDNLRQFADERGMSYETLRRYRQTASDWPPETRVSGVAWTVFRELTGPDRFEKLDAMVADGRAKTGPVRHDHGKAPHSVGPSSPAKERAEQVRRFMKDPRVKDLVRELEMEALNKKVAKHGGRVPSFQEVDEMMAHPVLDALQGAAKDRADWERAMTAAEQAVEALIALGPVADHDARADRMRQLQLKLLDGIVTEPVRR